MTSPHDIGNPGYGSSRVHPWDVVPPEPGRFDFIVDNVPGVDPMAFNREIDYQNMQQGVRNMLLEQERAARMDTQYRPADLVVSSPVAQSVVATQKQVVIAPIAKPIPVLKHKYLVIDERKPRSGDYENSIWELFMVRQVLFTAIFVLLAAMVANKSYWVLLSAFLFAFVYNSRYVVEQLEAIKNNTKPKLHLPVLATCSILTVLGGLILGGIAVTVTASLLLLVSVLCLFLGSVIISQKKFSIARKRAILQQAVDYSTPLGPCHICGKAAAVAMRRYFFFSPNHWSYYTPVCEKHRYYVREVYSGGSDQWPQDGDCTQPDLLKITIKK